MSYFWGQKGYTVPFQNPCEAADVVFINNSDGTVSAYSNSVSPNKPIPLSYSCCLAIKDPNYDYTFDLNTQKCYWSKINCQTQPFKLVLNPIGNDGTVFYVENNDNCSLNVSFNYLFKVKCDTLLDIINYSNNNSISENDTATLREIENLELKIDSTKILIEKYNNEIITLQAQISATSYSITCTKTNYVNNTNTNNWATNSSAFNKSAFNKLAISNTTPNLGSVAPFSFTTQNNTNSYFTNTNVNYCLTEPTGLNQWAQILGPVRYQNFLNGDSTSYSCTDVTQIETLNQTILTQNSANPSQIQPVLINSCTTPFGTKTNLINQLNILLTELTTAENNLIMLESELSGIQATNTFGVDTCGTPAQVFETFDASITIDVVSGNSLVTVYEYNLFPQIGYNNLFNYLSGRTNSGFYVCGNDLESNCTGINLTSENELTSCQTVVNSLVNSLFLESTFTSKAQLNSAINPKSFASEWLTFNTLITDPTIISQISNQKIKLSFKINNTCSDFCVLLEDIVLDKVCTSISKTDLFVTQSPGFNLKRIRDNKKSWVANNSLIEREFSISDKNGSNLIRETDYFVNDERLIINTKEVDLDIDLSYGIETDVWNYANNNSCFLSASGNTNVVDWKISGSTIDYNDFNNLSSKITTNKNNLLSKFTQWYLASITGYNLEITPYSNNFNLSQSLLNTYINTENAYITSVKNLSTANFGYIYGITKQPNISEYYNEPVSQTLKTNLNTINFLGPNNSNPNVVFYGVSNEDNTFSLYAQDIVNNPEVFVNYTDLVQNGTSDSSYAGFSGTGQYFCTYIGNIFNQYTAYKDITPNNNQYFRNINLNTNSDSLYIQWDSTKNKCIAKNELTIPESISIPFTKTQYCTYNGYNSDCFNASASTLETVGSYYKDYRDISISMLGNTLFSKQRQYLSFIKDPTTNIIPSVGTNLNVLVSIKKGSVSGITIYQETQHVTLLNSLKLTSNAPYISLNIGCADPNSLGYVGCSATYISGSTSGTPLFISSNNTINPTIDYSDNYYVHLDVTDLSSNVYYATNNDFNLKDSNNLIKFPSSASTQTLNINDIQTTLNNKFLKVVSDVNFYQAQTIINGGSNQ